MNKVILTGRLVSDDFKKFQSIKGGISLTFKIALIESSQKTNFIDIVCFDKMVNNITKYIKKGDLLEVEGKLNNSKYVTKDGKTIYKTEVIAKNIIFSVKAKPKDNSDKQGKNKEENILGFEYFDEDEE